MLCFRTVIVILVFVFLSLLLSEHFFSVLLGASHGRMFVLVCVLFRIIKNLPWVCGDWRRWDKDKAVCVLSLIFETLLCHALSIAECVRFNFQRPLIVEHPPTSHPQYGGILTSYSNTFPFNPYYS